MLFNTSTGHGRFGNYPWHEQVMRLIAILIVTTFIPFLRNVIAHSEVSEPASWSSELLSDLRALEQKLNFGFGIMITDIATGTVVGINHDRFWYLASTVKVPIAVEVLRQIEAGKIKFSSEVSFKTTHKRDGSGEVSYLKPGHKMSVQYLLEQMLWESDNAATDILVDLVTPRALLRYDDLVSAFESYYKKGLNSGTLVAFSNLLTLVTQKKLISPFVSEHLLNLMSKCRTGKNRILAGLLSHFTFAHKTGTQIRRLCDSGILTTPNKRTLVIAVCTEKWKNMKDAEFALAEAGRAISKSFK